MYRMCNCVLTPGVSLPKRPNFLLATDIPHLKTCIRVANIMFNLYQKCWPCRAADASLERQTIKCASIESIFSPWPARSWSRWLGRCWGTGQASSCTGRWSSPRHQDLHYTFVHCIVCTFRFWIIHIHAFYLSWWRGCSESCPWEAKHPAMHWYVRLIKVEKRWIYKQRCEFCKYFWEIWP